MKNDHYIVWRGHPEGQTPRHAQDWFGCRNMPRTPPTLSREEVAERYAQDLCDQDSIYYLKFSEGDFVVYVDDGKTTTKHQITADVQVYWNVRPGIRT